MPTTTTHDGMRKAPSQRQMLARMHDGHLRALRKIRDGIPMQALSVGDAIGLRVVLGTLSRWGAISLGGRGSPHTITDIGRELIAAKDPHP